MAIKKVKLPNNTVVDINDARIPGIDNTPTASSANPVQSGGVYDAIESLDEKFVQATPVGTFDPPEIAPYEYATKEELDTLNYVLFGGELPEDEDISSSFSFESPYFIRAAYPETGSAIGDIAGSSSSSSYANRNYVDISSYDKLRVTLVQLGVQGTAPGLCFYDSSYNVVEAVCRSEIAPASMAEYTISIPSDAKYVRTTWRSDIGSFSCYGVMDYPNGGMLTGLINDVSPILDGNSNSSDDITDSFEWEQSKMRKQNDGTLTSSGSSSYGSSLVDISDYQKLDVYVPVSNAIQSNAGWAFYDKSGSYIVGNALVGESTTMSEVLLNIPKNAKYFASTWLKNGDDDTFSCVGIRQASDGFSVLSNKVYDLLSDVANVKDYGAIGDGVMDDTAAVLAAFSSGRKRVYFPEGTYLVGKTLNVSTGMEVYGDGVGRSVIKWLGWSNSIQGGETNYTYYTWRSYQAKVLMHTASGGRDIFLHDLEFDGSDFTNSSIRYFGISIYGITDSKVENIYVHNINYDISRSPSVQMEYAFQFFIWGNSKRIIIHRCSGDYAGYENIGTEDVEDVVISDSCWLRGWRTSLQIHRGSKRVKVVNNTINNNSNTAHASFTIHGVTTNPIEDLIISGNTIVSSTNEEQGYRGGVAFVQSGFKNLIFTGNTFDGNSYCMVDLLSDGTSSTWPANLVIVDNIMKNSRYGLCLLRGNNYIIKDNIINTTNTAIQTTITKYIIKDNILPNNTTKTISGTAWSD